MTLTSAEPGPAEPRPADPGPAEPGPVESGRVESAVVALDLPGDVVDLAAALVDVRSVSGTEGPLADAVQRALAALPGLRVDRAGDTVVARTPDTGRPRLLLAGHLDTVPVAANVPSTRAAGRLAGCGSVDMKGGVAMLLHVVASVLAAGTARYDLTVVCYDHEEVAAELNGLGRVATAHPDWLAADLAVLAEPSNAVVEAGCQGTLRAELTLRGRRAHTARAWRGENAIHAAGPLLATLAGYPARTVTLDGCTYREGLSATAISGGVAGNVVPDRCVLTVNFRFAPDRDAAAAERHLRDEVFPGQPLTVTDCAEGAPPALGAPLAQAFLAAVGAPPVAKLGWTDVARFAALGVPALNFGPGDPLLAHSPDESVEESEIRGAAAVLERFVTTPPPVSTGGGGG